MENDRRAVGCAIASIVLVLGVIGLVAFVIIHFIAKFR